jgi:hypothetical protein
MIFTYRSARNLGLLTSGMIIGCILAYVARIPSFSLITLLVYLLPFIIAMFIGVAKTTTA